MTMNNEHLLSLGGLALVGGVVLWRVFTMGQPAHVVLDIDPSGSVKMSCPDLRRAAENYLTSPKIRPGSTLSILVMGASALNPEPDVRFSKPIPIPSDNVFGQDAEAFRKELKSFLDEMEAECNSAKATQHSPIYRLVQRGVEHLRSLGCKADGICYYLIKTDLMEDVQPDLRTAIRQAIKNSDISLPASLVRSIDNAGVEIRFCGTRKCSPGAGAMSPLRRQRHSIISGSKCSPTRSS